MPIYGVDVHPRYQAGIDIEGIRREGFDFLAVKISEGTNSSFMAAGSADFLRRGRAAGLLCLGYHYLRAGNEDAQARVFAEQLRIAGVPGMLDAEALGSDTLSIDGIRLFLDRARAHGAHIPLLYLPHWYWVRIGRPDLRGLPPLWASRYVPGDSGPASAMYQRHNPAGWDPYGGLNVAVLQFTDKAAVAGRQIDANHYRGTREQLAALIGTSEDDMNPDQARMLAEVHHELTQRLPSRSEYAADPPPTDTLLGAALNADARAHEALTELRHLKAALPGVVDELVRTALADGLVDVDITVRNRTTGSEAGASDPIAPTPGP